MKPDVSFKVLKNQQSIIVKQKSGVIVIRLFQGLEISFSIIK